MSRVAAAQVFTKQRYVAICQLLLLLAVVASLMIAGTRVTRLDIVGSNTSTPTDQSVHTPATTR